MRWTMTIRKIAMIALGVMFAGAIPAHAQSTPPAPPPAARPTPFDIVRVHGGVDIPYLLVHPPMFAPAKAYPVLILFGDGAQDRDAVRAALAAGWETEAAARGWVVVGVAAPLGTHLLQVSAEAFSGLLDDVARALTVQEGKFYIAGAGEGGKAALLHASQAPTRMRSVLVRPGFAEDWFMGTAQAGLKDVPVTFLIGDHDDAYFAPTENTVAKIQSAGAMRCYEVIYGGEGRDISVQPAELFGMLLAAEQGKAPSTAMLPRENRGSPDNLPAAHADAAPQTHVIAIEKVLDTLHDAAAKADEDRYFNLYAPGAVFLGTDAAERWTLTEFKAFAHPYFAKGKAWTYTPVKGTRHIGLEGEHHDVAWFDEQLENDTLGRCRGSGVLVRTGDTWKIRQYNLTMLIPNDVAAEAAKLGSAAGEKDINKDAK